MAKIKVPFDTSTFKSKFKAALQKKPAPAGGIKNPDAKARAEKEAAARVKARELAKELESTKLTAEEKDGIIAELKEQLATVTNERDTFKPKADSWTRYENIERAKILEQIPTESRKEAKELPLSALKTFAKAFTGGGPAGGSGDKKPEAMSYEEAEAKGPDAINKWFDAQEKGKGAAV
jgi:hypothetical protein